MLDGCGLARAAVGGDVDVVVAYRSQCAAPGEDCRKLVSRCCCVWTIDHDDHDLKTKTWRGGQLTRHRWGGGLSC